MRRLRTKKTTKQLTAESGMGMVEVIAALLILSLALIPLMDMAQSIQTQAVRVEDRQIAAEKTQSALSYFRTINVGESPQGEQNFGDWTLKWEAGLVGEQTAFVKNRRVGRRAIGLFNVELTLSYVLDGQLQQRVFQTRAVGWSDAGIFEGQ